jgi:hypothetical protein
MEFRNEMVGTRIAKRFTAKTFVLEVGNAWIVRTQYKTCHGHQI